MTGGDDGAGRQSTRRRHLRRLAVVAAAGLTGCATLGDGSGGNENGDGNGDGADEPTATPTRTATRTPVPTGAATGVSTPTRTPPPELPVTLSGTYPAYRGGPGRRAFAPAVADPGPGVTVAYSLDLPAAVFQPVVAGTTVYLARRRRDPGAPTVEAFDLRRGTRLWGRDLGADAAGPPSVAGGRLFVATGDGTHALVSNGTVAWETDDGAGALFPPAVTAERVFVAGERSLTALAHDGTVEWSLPTSVRPLAAPAADGERVYLAVPRESGGRDLVALDAASGRSRWRRPVQVDTGAAPVVAGDTVYATSRLVQGGVTALPTAGGDPLWRGDIRPPRPPAVTADRIVAAGRSLVRGYDRDGGVVWETDLAAEVVAGPVAGGDTAYLAVPGENATAVLLAFETATGETRWSLALDRRLDALPAVVDGGLVAATRDDAPGPERLLVVTSE